MFLQFKFNINIDFFKIYYYKSFILLLKDSLKVNINKVLFIIKIYYYLYKFY